MVARLFLILLLVGLALPANAAMPCHDGAPAAMAGMAQHGPDAPAKAAPAHVCIGCVPPSSWRAGNLAAPPRPAPLLVGRPLRALIAGRPAAPEPPPPRLA